MTLPNFLIVGVEKAGTTSIYNYLKQHPQVYMSPVKETNFLEKDWETLIKDHNFKGKPSKIVTFEQYKALFEGVTDEIAIGEASPNYLFHYESSAARIRKYVPEAKLIAILRDPAERAYSDYLMHVRDEIQSTVKTLSLSEQIKLKGETSFTLRKGLYYQPIKYYFEQFSPEQVRIYFYKDLSKNSLEFMQNIYKFIGVNDNFEVDTSKKAQTAAIPKSRALNKLIRTDNPLRTSIRTLIKPFIPLSLRAKARKTILELNSNTKNTDPLSPELRQALVDYYRDDILKLQDLIQQDLADWLKT